MWVRKIKTKLEQGCTGWVNRKPQRVARTAARKRTSQQKPTAKHKYEKNSRFVESKKRSSGSSSRAAPKAFHPAPCRRRGTGNSQAVPRSAAPQFAPMLSVAVKAGQGNKRAEHLACPFLVEGRCTPAVNHKAQCLNSAATADTARLASGPPWLDGPHLADPVARAIPPVSLVGCVWFVFFRVEAAPVVG